MKIEIDVPDENPMFARYLVKHILRGIALGCRPLFVGEHALPPLYDTDVVFKIDPKYGSGIEKFRLPFEILNAGWGDCDGLCIYEVSRRLATGEDPEADISVADYLEDGGMHVQIRQGYGDRDIEDPSMRLGSSTDWPEWFLYDREVVG